MKVATINIRSVKLHTTKPPRPSNGGDGGERSAAATTNTTGDKTVTDPVFVQVFEAPVPDPLNDKTFRVLVAQTIVKTSGRLISPLTEASVSVVGGCFSPFDVCIYFVDATTSSNY